MLNKKQVLSAVTGSVVLSALLIGSTAFAAGPGMMGRTPGVFGTVSAISGNTITITSKGFGANATAQTYTVDATGAAITKGGAKGVAPATITVSGITVGDTIMAQGTVTGTNVVATKIRDGAMGGRGMGRPDGDTEQGKVAHTPATPVIQGNGQPVIGGTITAMTGSTLTVTNKSNVTYTVDAAQAKVEKSNALSTVAALAVGDAVVVQGTVNGTTVTATSVMDSGAAPFAGATPSTTTHQGGLGGFFGGIGGFFHNLFGFF